METLVSEDWRGASHNLSAANWLIHFDSWFLIGWNAFPRCEKVVSRLRLDEGISVWVFYIIDSIWKSQWVWNTYHLRPSTHCFLGRLNCVWYTFEHSRNYSKKLPDVGWSSAIFGNRKCSGDFWRWSKTFGWHSSVSGRVWMIFGSARKKSNYLQLSSKGFGWTSSTTVGSHECLRSNFGYLRCKLRSFVANHID